MTVQTYSSIIAHSSDVDFRAWGIQFSNALTAAGFIKSADTGQVDWGTVARPGVNSSVYEIRYLNDSLHGTKPIYLKLEYGTHPGSATLPCMWITAGSATNGAGTISGTTYFARKENYRVASLIGTSTPTYICVKDGYVATLWARGIHTGGTTGGLFFALCRTTDSSGTMTNEGFHLFWSSSNIYLYRSTYISSEVVDEVNGVVFPGIISNSTLTGGNPQVFKHYAFCPEIRVIPYMLAYKNSEIGSVSTFDTIPIGVTTRTYLAIGIASMPISTANLYNGSIGVAFQYD